MNQRVIKITPTLADLLKRQRKRFARKFGREAGEDDPIFFDPDQDEPVPMPFEKFQTMVLDAMQQAGVAPQIVYAYATTGLLLDESNMDSYPADMRQEWEEAIKKYFAEVKTR